MEPLFSEISIYGIFVAIIIPLILVFTLPLLFLSLIAVFGPLVTNIYRLFYKILFKKEPTVLKEFHIIRIIFSLIFLAHSYIWHSYEVVNFDRIPKSGPALLVYYHGAIAADYFYLFAKCYLQKRTSLRTIGDRILLNLPGFKLWMKVSLASPGTIEECIKMLNEGNLVSIAPGGVREAQFSHNYDLLWNNRIGFAKIAIAAKVPIIPVFTVNIREAYRTLSFGQKIFRKLYEKTRFPVVPIYGGFPVKLKTVIGKPIEFDANVTPEQLATKTAKAIENLIEENQRIPGNIFDATMDRFPKSVDY